MNKYIKTLTYGLKDLKGTQEKYKDYKTKEFNVLINSKQETIRVHFEYLQQDIEKDFYTGSRRYCFEFSDLRTKMDVRFLKTNINHSCQEINENFMESIIPKPNKNKIRCFAIRFYLEYYAKINKIMHNTLKSIMEGEADERSRV